MFAEKTIEILKQYVEERHGGKVLRASSELGIPNDTLYRWVTGQRDPGLLKIGPVIDKILSEHANPQDIERIVVKFPAMPSTSTENNEEHDMLLAKIRHLEEHIIELQDELIAYLRENAKEKQTPSSVTQKINTLQPLHDNITS